MTHTQTLVEPSRDPSASSSSSTTTALTPASSSRRFAKIVHIAAATLLTVAALLKAYQTVHNPDVLPLTTRLYEAALIEFELALAALLVLSRWRSFAWAAGVATFTIFAGVSVRKWLGGASSCGCFGPVVMDPRVTSAIDVVIVGLLLFAGPWRAIETAPGGNRAARRAGIALFALLMLGSFAAAAYAAAPKRGLVAAG